MQTNNGTSFSVGIALWGKCLFEHPDENFAPLIEFLVGHGIALKPLRDREYSHFVALDYSVRAFKNYGRTVQPSRRLLIAFEPRAVNPAQYLQRVRSRFGQTCVLSPLQKASPEDKVLSLGPFVDLDVLRNFCSSPIEERKPGIVVLNENKFSFVPRNYYKLRRDAMRLLAESGYQVHLGGKNWDKSVFWQHVQQAKTMLATVKAGSEFKVSNWEFGSLARSSRIALYGRVENGIDFIASHRVALVIENDPSYLSEKLLHAVFAGAVPIYVGPSLQFFDIPADIALSCNGTPESILETVSSLDSINLQKLSDAGRSWLAQPGVLEKWSLQNAMRQMGSVVTDFVVGDEG